MDNDASSRQTEIFRALGDPTRRAIYEQLITREESVSALTAQFSFSQPAISQHLKTLRDTGLVKVRREGREAHYRADAEGLKPLLSWLNHYERFWRTRDACLKAVQKEMDE